MYLLGLPSCFAVGIVTEFSTVSSQHQKRSCGRSETVHPRQTLSRHVNPVNITSFTPKPSAGQRRRAPPGADTARRSWRSGRKAQAGRARAELFGHRKRAAKRFKSFCPCHRRRGLRIVRDDDSFFESSPLTRSVAPPPKMRLASLDSHFAFLDVGVLTDYYTTRVRILVGSLLC